MDRSRRELLEAIAEGKSRNAPLTPDEEKTLRAANVYLMDWVADGWGPLPPKIAKIEALTRKLKPAEARDLLDWFRENAPGDFS